MIMLEVSSSATDWFEEEALRKELRQTNLLNISSKAELLMKLYS